MKHTGTKVMGWVAVAVLALSAGSAMAGKQVAKKEISGVVNLNTGTAQQLDLLPGIGEKAAKRIIEHRTKTPFAKVDDLRKVKGFGAKKLEKLKPLPHHLGADHGVGEEGEGRRRLPEPAPAAQGRRAQKR